MKSMAELIARARSEIANSKFLGALLDVKPGRARGRPKGGTIKFPGIKAFAACMGVTPLHVHQVLTGRRHSRRVTEAWSRRTAV